MGPSCVPAVELVGEQLGAPGVVVHVLDERVLDGHAPAGGQEVVVGGVEQLADLPLGVDGDELVSQLVVGGVQGDGQGHRQPLAGEPADEGNQPYRGDGDAAG